MDEEKPATIEEYFSDLNQPREPHKNISLPLVLPKIDEPPQEVVKEPSVEVTKKSAKEKDTSKKEKSKEKIEPVKVKSKEQKVEVPKEKRELTKDKSKEFRIEDQLARLLKKSHSSPAICVKIRETKEVVLSEPFFEARPFTKPQMIGSHVLSISETQRLLNFEDSFSIRNLLGGLITKPDNKKSHHLLIELLTNVIEFCKNNDFTVEKTQTLFSMFYITHDYLETFLWRSAEEIYLYFRELILLHSVLHPPKRIKIFTPLESRKALIFFCTIYLRNLPLIRTFCLPNYKLNLDWTSNEPEPIQKGKK